MTKLSLSWCAALLLGAFTILNSAVAATHVWSGAVNAKWSVAGNWSSGGVPAFGETSVVLRFPSAGVNRELTNDVAQLTVQRIELTGNGYRLYGNSILMTNAHTGTNFSVVAGMGGTLDLPIILPNGTFTAAAGSSGTLEFSGPISGYGALHKLGAGNVKFSGDDGNTFTGGFHLIGGKAYLGKTMGVALPGPVFIGLTNEPAVFGQEPNFVVAYLAHNQIADAADIHVWGGASELDLNGYNDTVNDLDLVDGSVTTWSSSFGPDGTLRINGDVAATQVVLDDGLEPHIYGKLDLGNLPHTFTIPQNRRLLLFADVSSTGTNGGIILQAGTLQLHGSNSFSGPLRVQSGEVYAYANFAFGSSVGATILEGINCGVFIGYGLTIAAEPLQVLHDGWFDVAATNAWNGPIFVAANAELDVEGSYFGGTDWLTLGGAITGPGNLYIYMDRVDLTGTSANTLSGQVTVFSKTVVNLTKTNANALAGTVLLKGGSTNAQIRWLRSDQVADTAKIKFENYGYNRNGAIYLNGFSDTIGSLESGYYNLVSCGSGQLTVGGNNQHCTFSGTIEGNAGATNLIKIGTGVLTLSGSQSLAGKTLVNGGTLVLENVSGIAAVQVNSGGHLAGNSTLGALTASGTGRIEPGLVGDLKYGTLTPASFNLGGGIFRCGLGGCQPGVNYDQVATTGPLFLSSTTLELSTLGVPTGSNTFTLINVTNAGLVLGTFNALPDGATFTSLHGHQFRINYHGGDGNDVVVTRVDPVPPSPQITGLSSLPNGQIQIKANGIASLAYVVQATTSLTPAEWVNLDVAIADQAGLVQYTDTNAPNFPQRFYRLLIP